VGGENGLINVNYLMLLVITLNLKQGGIIMPNGSGGKEIKVNFPQELQGGVYANNMVVTHTKEEFILDFLMVAPPAGTVTARVIVSPGHMKRILEAIRENLSKYENTFGTIQIAEEPKGKVGSA
jgi:hypothetical protein